MINNYLIYLMLMMLLPQMLYSFQKLMNMSKAYKHIAVVADITSLQQRKKRNMSTSNWTIIKLNVNETKWNTLKFSTESNGTLEAITFDSNLNAVTIKNKCIHNISPGGLEYVVENGSIATAFHDVESVSKEEYVLIDKKNMTVQKQTTTVTFDTIYGDVVRKARHTVLTTRCMVTKSNKEKQSLETMSFKANAKSKYNFFVLDIAANTFIIANDSINDISSNGLNYNFKKMELSTFFHDVTSIEYTTTIWVDEERGFAREVTTTADIKRTYGAVQPIDDVSKAAVGVEIEYGDSSERVAEVDLSSPAVRKVQAHYQAYAATRGFDIA